MDENKVVDEVIDDADWTSEGYSDNRRGDDEAEVTLTIEALAAEIGEEESEEEEVEAEAEEVDAE